MQSVTDGWTDRTLAYKSNRWSMWSMRTSTLFTLTPKFLTTPKSPTCQEPWNKKDEKSRQKAAKTNGSTLQSGVVSWEKGGQQNKEQATSTRSPRTSGRLHQDSNFKTRTGWGVQWWNHTSPTGNRLGDHRPPALQHILQGSVEREFCMFLITGSQV